MATAIMGRNAVEAVHEPNFEKKQTLYCISEQLFVTKTKRKKIEVKIKMKNSCLRKK